MGDRDATGRCKASAHVRVLAETKFTVGRAQ